MARRKSRNSRSRWATIPLETKTADRQKLHDLEDKHDGIDRSRHLVRNGRFSGSYMMGTHGGSTFEKGLRSPPRKSLLEPATVVPPSHSLRRNGLQNNIAPGAAVVIDDTSTIPAKSIGLLEITYAEGPQYWGTAWLIGPNTLATAGHNLISPQHGKAISLRVALAYDGNSAGGGWHKIVGNAMSPDWKANPDPGNSHDFAVIKIEDPSIGNDLGWFGYADYHDDKFSDMIVNVYGYPVDAGSHVQMYASGGRVNSFDATRLYYDCATAGGMSGGPVFALFGEQRVAVGIHVAGGDGSNVATRITDEVYDLFLDHKSWP